MRILILDTIHGGIVLGDALSQNGHTVEYVDVYRGDISHPGSIRSAEAAEREYDLLIHPVHLDPAYPLLRLLSCPSITHHEAVRWILGKNPEITSKPGDYIVEITGARGKTTTATALAFILEGTGVLHTSRGIFRYPEEKFITRMSITPASLITVFNEYSGREWMIGEVSLGFCGISDLAILTSAVDYQVAAGRRNAWEIKKESALRCRRLLVPPGISAGHDTEINAGDLINISGTCCRYSFGELQGEFKNPLFILDAYRIPLQLACAASLVMGKKPDRLQEFLALPGRLQIIRENDGVFIDNANSGTSLTTTRDAISILREICPNNPISLVIGQEEHAVCENFLTEDILTAVREEKPFRVILVCGDERIDIQTIIAFCDEEAIPVTVVKTLDEGIATAKKEDDFAFVVSVKTWR